MDEVKTEFSDNSFIGRHRFMLFIIFSLFVAAIIISTSMFMYNISGAAQLDLSRPGYNDVRSKTTITDGDFQTFSSNGTLNGGDLSYFKTLFNKQIKKVKAIDAFGSDSLDPEALGIGAPIDEQQ